MAYMSDYLSYTPAQFYKATYNDLKKYLSGGGGGGGITSVNGQTGPIVTLTAADVGAVSTVNGQSGPTVTLTAADVGAVSTNIYTADGSTPGLRTVTLGGNLVFSGNRVQATKFFAQAVGTSTTTYPLEIQTSVGGNAFRVGETGVGEFATSVNVAGGIWVMDANSLTKSGHTLRSTHTASATNGIEFRMYNSTGATYTSGSRVHLQLEGSYTVATGSGIWTGIKFLTTFNQTGSASGQLTGIEYKPTVTSITGVHRFIDATVGDVVVNQTSGSTIIGGTTNTNSSKLNVIGTVEGTKHFSKAVSNSTTTYPIEVQVSGNTNPAFRVNEVGTINFGGSTICTLSPGTLAFSAGTVTMQPGNSGTTTGNFFAISSNTSTHTSAAASSLAILATFTVASGAGLHNGIYIAGTYNQTGTASGACRGLLVSPTLTSAVDYRGVEIFTTFAPTSGTGIFTGLLYRSTINQTGGANGITRAIYIDPTITAAADFRAFDSTLGKIVFGGVVAAGSLADDSAAASAGIPVGGLYHTSGTIKIRLT